jgi:hypothetical protein
MDTNNNDSQQQAPKRRASESEAQLALVSNQYNYNRIPPPLPYLPSDYRPSPDSPRHFMAASASTSNSTPSPFFDMNRNKRQRSRSIGHPLAIENSSSSIGSSNSQQLLQPPQQQHSELVRYREWTVIA